MRFSTLLDLDGIKLMRSSSGNEPQSKETTSNECIKIKDGREFSLSSLIKIVPLIQNGPSPKYNQLFSFLSADVYKLAKGGK